jgi:hypothetical protein
MAEYLHQHQEFRELLRIIADEKGIEPGLAEKDYWIMHTLFGLQSKDYQFELKGGTSLSKGFKIIDRFSEDIDIHIKPPQDQKVNENPKNANPVNVAARKNFYDWLAGDIQIDSIIRVERDTDFDNTKSYTSGGIRLFYDNVFDPVEGLKEGILLEAGFDQVAPNQKLTISSWAYDFAIARGIDIIDNRAKDIVCYDPAYTFVEKLQTIAAKYRKEMETGVPNKNFIRQYYDVYSLLGRDEILAFIGTDAYLQHKEKRFSNADLEIPICKNEAFLLNDENGRASFKQRYAATATLYYNGQPAFEDIMARIRQHVDKL